VAAPSKERLARLIADLDSGQFDVRRKAAAELQRLGELAGPALRQALAGRPSPEVRRSVGPLLAQLEHDQHSPERLRGLRAVAVLEHVGTPAARQALEGLSHGAEGARLTEEARAALARLARRGPAP
jgi:HEAT repeat protein